MVTSLELDCCAARVNTQNEVQAFGDFAPCMADRWMASFVNTRRSSAATSTLSGLPESQADREQRKGAKLDSFAVHAGKAVFARRRRKPLDHDAHLVAGFLRFFSKSSLTSSCNIDVNGRINAAQLVGMSNYKCRAPALPFCIRRSCEPKRSPYEMFGKKQIQS